jgi:hypothetical protein
VGFERLPGHKPVGATARPTGQGRPRSWFGSGGGISFHEALAAEADPPDAPRGTANREFVASDVPSDHRAGSDRRMAPDVDASHYNSSGANGTAGAERGWAHRPVICVRHIALLA